MSDEQGEEAASRTSPPRACAADVASEAALAEQQAQPVGKRMRALVLFCGRFSRFPQSEA